MGPLNPGIEPDIAAAAEQGQEGNHFCCCNLCLLGTILAFQEFNYPDNQAAQH
jgi:hypothetical protein